MSKVTKGVYCLTSPSGKRYVGIGISKNGIERRWSRYKKLSSCVKKQKLLYRALKKYGPENFKYEVVLETEDEDNAKRSEMYLIDVWNLQDPKFGYNLTAGGDGRLGAKLSEESKEKMSNSAKESFKNGRQPSSTCFKKGHKISEAHKGILKLLKNNLGKKASEETKRKSSESHKGKPGYWTGKKRKFSEEHMKNMKIAGDKRKGVKRGPYKTRGII
jgi:hypothetical protein